MAPITNADLKERARVAAASAGSAPRAGRRQPHRTRHALVDEDARHPGTAPANASAENGRCMRMAAVLAIRPMARHPTKVEARHAQVIETGMTADDAPTMPQRIDTQTTRHGAL